MTIDNINCTDMNSLNSLDSFMRDNYVIKLDSRLTVKDIYEDFRVWIIEKFGIPAWNNVTQRQVYAALKELPDYAYVRYREGYCLKGISYKSNDKEPQSPFILSIDKSKSFGNNGSENIATREPKLLSPILNSPSSGLIPITLNINPILELTQNIGQIGTTHIELNLNGSTEIITDNSTTQVIPKNETNPIPTGGIKPLFPKVPRVILPKAFQTTTM